ncbi:hypothetical protein [uncultured Rhodoblastus sp.]|uniref:hypothetical protein n=1 Tax=uncultured Rhodoblastus sp. TaxID=543037 RepID=UPI0025F4E824|nr:hypothetical protein [uncultured Rhodoblastus sp.]
MKAIGCRPLVGGDTGLYFIVLRQERLCGRRLGDGPGIPADRKPNLCCDWAAKKPIADPARKKPCSIRKNTYATKGMTLERVFTMDAAHWFGYKLCCFSGPAE